MTIPAPHREFFQKLKALFAEYGIEYTEVFSVTIEGQFFEITWDEGAKRLHAHELRYNGLPETF